MNKKKILIHSIVFSPDGVSTAYLYNDIALKFKEEGYEVLVLTTTPHYNVLPEELKKQPLNKKLFGLYYESNFHGVRVLHISQKKFKNSLLRIAGFVYWHIFSFFLVLFQNRIDVILSPSPPLTIGIINLLIGRIKGAKVIYNVQEIYPDFLLNQGKLKFKPVISALKWIERIVYNRSDAVTTIDEVFYQTIINRFDNKSKLRIIPNFVDTELYQPMSLRDDSLDSQYFSKNVSSLKIMYAGNIGHAQSWDPFLQLARSVSGKNVEFWVIGEGVMKSYLEEQILLNDLTNIHLVPYQSRELMPSLIAYADLHFIFMSPEMEGQGFPSKVYTIMACAKPLMIISGNRTPIYNFLEPLGCAYLISNKILADQLPIMNEIIDSALYDKAQLLEMGYKGYEHIKNAYSKEKVTQQYINLADEVILNS